MDDDNNKKEALAKAYHDDLKSFIQKYEDYSDQIMSITAISMLSTLIEGAIQPIGDPLKQQYLDSIQEIDKFSLQQGKNIIAILKQQRGNQDNNK